MQHDPSRREFIKRGALLAATAGIPPFARAASGGDPLKVALIGCGGRGARPRAGALANFIEAAGLLGRKADIVALADVFPEKARTAASNFEVPANRVISGIDAYRRVMESDAQFVIFATPPVFRALHLAAAVDAGKHVFIEKPVAVDPVGVRKVIEIGERARSKGLSVVAGTQRRHQAGYLKNKAMIDAGAIGEILGGTVSWNGKVPWIVRRGAQWSNREYLLRNWLNFAELSGDHICEQHIHNIDVANWFIGRPPVSAIGFGARMRRETGNQFDFFSVDFDYGNGVHIHSQCRQISGCYDRVGEFFRGSRGEVHAGGKLTGKETSVPEIHVKSDNPMVQEHVHLIESVLSGTPVNYARQVAESTMVAIMGRISAYTGKLVRWVDLMQNAESPHYNLALTPAAADYERSEDLRLPDEVPPIPGDGAALNVRT